LASKVDLSSGLGWKDVAGNLVAFEAINGVRLELRISTADHHGRADLAVAALAHNRKAEIGGQPPLGSVSVTISGTRLKSLEGALIHALYLLDAQLAERELRTEEPA
jgi:hypothetical protein